MWTCERAGLLLPALLLACRQDMHNQPKYIPLRPSTSFADGTSARPLVPGTVPRGFLREDPERYQGRRAADQALVETLPFPLTMAVLERGQERFAIFCSPCHGLMAYGEGMVAQRGFSTPPSLHLDRLRTAPVGYFFQVITHGYGAMPSYAAQIPPGDRWAIIAYVRALQLSQRATRADVPAGEHLP